MKKLFTTIFVLAILCLGHSAFAASRFWVGGTGTWDGSTTTHWATTSGGAGGASVPGTGDDVTFDSNSNAAAYTVSITAAPANSDNVTIGAPASGKVTIAGSAIWNIFGNLNLTGGSSGITFTESSPDMAATTGTVAITTNGVSFQNLTFGNSSAGGSGATFNMNDDLNIAAGLTIRQGTFNTNNHNITCSGSSATMAIGNATLTSVVNLGSSVLEDEGNFFGGVFTVTSANLTFNAGTSLIEIVNTSSAGTLNLGSVTYNNFTITGISTATGALTIAGSNTFNTFTDTNVATHSLLFTTGTTNTFTSFVVNGSSGHLITINSTTTGTHALAITGGGIVNDTWLNIQHSVATPSLTWYAGVNSTNNQGVTTAGSGWIFTAPPIIVSSDITQNIIFFN